MRHIVGLLYRFRKDEGGAFALVFAVMAIVLIAMGGAAVDFTSIEQARTRTQTALDAAALALQPSIYSATTSTIQSQAQALLATQLADGATTWANCTGNGNKAPCATVTTPVVNTIDGQLTLTANLNIQMNFVSLVGVQSMPAQIVSVATRKKLGLEVAMALDNSGSMAYTMGYNKTLTSNPNNLPSRMDTLISSAECAANILFYSVPDCSTSTSGKTANTSVKIGLVPFTMEVNVGAANAGAAWLDRSGPGVNDIARDNFDDDDNFSTAFTAGSVDRVALFNTIKDKNGNAMSWGGCVQARKTPYDTDNTTPTTSNSDTLFTPFFAPDEPDQTSGASVHGETFSNSYLADTSTNCKANPTVVWTSTKSPCSTKITTKNQTNAQMEASFAAVSCSKTNTYVETDQNGTVTYPASLPATIYNNPVPADYQEAFTTGGSSGSYTNTQTRTYYYLSDRVLQERLCKYKTSSGGRVSMNAQPSGSGAFGPNSDCPINTPVTPLTSTPSTVLTAIGNMSAVGGTNITEGAAWGYRVLSPGDPFNASNFTSSTSKVLIIMTDGENTSYAGSSPTVNGSTPNMNGETYDSAYGYPWNNDKTNTGSPQRQRLGAMGWPDTSTSGNSLEGEMNSRLSTVCTNAKTAGITVYTIGVGTTYTDDPAATQTLLTNCASPTGDDGAIHYFFPNSVADLEGAFVKIATQLADLRLAR